MYLTKRTYIGAEYDHRNAVGQVDYIVNGKKKHIDPKKVTYIHERIGYWRKANHLHKWFVDNCQDGEDDCRESYVSKNKLKELLDICKKIVSSVVTIEGDIQIGTSFQNGKATPMMEKGQVVLNSQVCEDLLPTQSGFFFGSTTYDEYYLDTLKYTINILEEALTPEAEEDCDVDFMYQSSW